MGIFPTVARINHSCKPNAHHFYNPDTGEEEVEKVLNSFWHHLHQVWVVEAIPAGCEICISYIRTFCRFVTGFVWTCQLNFVLKHCLCNLSRMTYITWVFLQPELSAAVTTGKVWFFLLLHQMQVRHQMHQMQVRHHSLNQMHIVSNAGKVVMLSSTDLGPAKFSSCKYDSFAVFHAIWAVFIISCISNCQVPLLT